MKQFSINHKHNEHETQEKVKTGGRVAPHPGWSLPPLVISDNASAHGPKRVKTEFWSGGGLLFMKYGCFIFHLLLPGWFTNLYNSRETRKTKQSPLSCIISYYWQYHYFAPCWNKWFPVVPGTEGVEKNKTCRSSAFRLLTLLKVPIKLWSREPMRRSGCNKVEMIFHE